MKKIIIAIIILLYLATNSFADKIQFPFSCYPKELQRVFAERGMKLDLSGNDRTPDSWGFLRNEGAEFWLYTYRPVSTEDLELIKRIMLGTEEE